MIARITCALCVLLLGAGPGYAQERTMAIFGHWTLSCVSASGQKVKSCGLVQVQKFGNQTSAASQIGIGRGSSGPYKISIQIPADVWMPSGAKLIFGDGASVINAAFKWCVSTHCLADADLSDANIKTLRTTK